MNPRRLPEEVRELMEANPHSAWAIERAYLAGVGE